MFQGYCTDEAGRTSLDLGDWCLKTGEAAVPILEPGVIHGATHIYTATFFPRNTFLTAQLWTEFDDALFLCK